MTQTIDLNTDHMPYVVYLYCDKFESLFRCGEWWQILQGERYNLQLFESYFNEDLYDYKVTENSVFIHNTASVASTACLEGPAIIDAYTEVRHGAYIRPNSIIGAHCVIGNSCEIKNSILFDYVQVPHFNYIGDSILGYKAHFGAGAITSNLKSDGSDIVVNGVNTQLRKLGSLVGDYAEIGCNSVLNPGTVIGSNTTVYPNSTVRGVVPANSIYKGKNSIIQKRG